MFRTTSSNPSNETSRGTAAVSGLWALALCLVAAAPALGQTTLWSTTSEAEIYLTDEVTKTVSPQRDLEVADDFFAQGQVEGVFVDAEGGCCNPPLLGLYVRFYEKTAGGPGALQAEHFVPAGDPGFTYDPYSQADIDVQLPTPFAATGWHFVSVQMSYDPYAWWRIHTANRFTPEGEALWQRDRLTAEPWGPATNRYGIEIDPSDLSLELYGTEGSTVPIVSQITPAATTRSGRLFIEGFNFGGSQGASQVFVDGAAALVTRWTDTAIVAYVPETAGPGPVDLEVVVDGQVSDPAALDVSLRQQVGRVTWRFPIDANYVSHRPGIGPDGTVYTCDVKGRLWAVAPDGALLWVVDALRGQIGLGAEGPVDVGADGTIYAAVNPLGPPIDLVAYNPDGSLAWAYDLPTGLGYQAGPNVGPDGNVYAVINEGAGHTAVSFTPDGVLRWNTAANPNLHEEGGIGADLVFGPSQAGGPADQLLVFSDQNGPSGVFVFDMDTGAQESFVSVPTTNSYFQQFQIQVETNTKTGDFYNVEFLASGPGWGLRQFEPDGTPGWRFDPDIASEVSAPSVGPDGTIYFSWDISRVSAVSPAGSELWRHTEFVAYGVGPVPSPANDLVIQCGVPTYGQPGFIQALSTADGSFLFQEDLPAEVGGNVVPDARAMFTPDGRTVYVQATTLGGPPENEYCYLYAVDTDLGAGTVSVALDCVPASGTLPLTVQFTTGLENTTAFSRQVAARVDAALASGTVIGSYRTGFTNLSPLEVFVRSWGQAFPALGSLAGDNFFTIEAEDVTPAPFNQPPYPPSGDTATDGCTVTAAAP
jgi:hypothetical protein